MRWRLSSLYKRCDGLTFSTVGRYRLQWTISAASDNAEITPYTKREVWLCETIKGPACKNKAHHPWHHSRSLLSIERYHKPPDGAIGIYRKRQKLCRRKFSRFIGFYHNAGKKFAVSLNKFIKLVGNTFAGC